TKFCDIFNWLAFARNDDVATGCFIALKMEPPVSNSDQRHELFEIMFDEKNISVTHRKLRRVAHQHRFISDGTPEHSNRVGRTRLTFDAICDLECDIRLNVTVGALAFPNRFSVRDRALKNELSLLNQLLEGRRNHRGRVRGRESEGSENDWEKILNFHVIGKLKFYRRIDTDADVGKDNV